MSETNGVRGETVTIGGFGGDIIPAYVARPEGPGEFPMVVVLHHRDGWDRASKEAALRLAMGGYVAIMPHLHHRWAPGASYEEAARLSLAAGGVSNAQVLADTEGAIDYLRKQAYTTEKIGVIGYCSGGRQSFYVSTQLPFDATVMCYGPKIIASESDLNEVTPISPITLADGLTGPVLGLYGAEDKNPSPEVIAAIDAELTRLGKTHTFITYPDAGHAFFAVDKPSYRVQAANDGWGEVFAWLDTYLTGTSDDRGE